MNVIRVRGKGNSQQDLRASGDLFASCGNPNDSGDSPTFVSRLEGRPHDLHVTSTIKRVVESTVRHVDQMILELPALWQVCRVNKLGGLEFLRPGFLPGIGVDGDDAGSTDHSTVCYHTETYGAATEHGNGRSL